MDRMLQISIDCADPVGLVRFWSAALGYVPEPPPAGFATWNDYWRDVGVPDDELPTDVDAQDSIVDPAGVGPRVRFQVVPEPKAGKNRLHLDLKVSGGRGVPLADRRQRVLAEARRLTALGATELRTLDSEGLDHFAVVLADPEGNEFCVA
jgi:Glyoxalase-like domain